jgi:predicted TIM-barrel enzyme
MMKIFMGIGGVLGVIVAIGAAYWYLFEREAFAQATAARTTVVEGNQRTMSADQRTMGEAVQALTDIHVRQETVQQAEQNMRVKLCAENKLKGADCAGVEGTD